MWPWGHLAVGYLLYSAAVRLRTGRPPRAAAVVLLLAGTQLPDVVDKPLAWVYHVVPQGYAVGHSVFVAVPVGLVAALGGIAYGRSALSGRHRGFFDRHGGAPEGRPGTSDGRHGATDGGTGPVDGGRAGAAGVAFAVGWWSHLAGDVAVALARGNPYAFDRVLWPVSNLPPLDRSVTAVGRVRYFLDNWLDILATADSSLLLLAYAGPLLAAGLLWLVDGAPGVPTARFRTRRQ